MTLAELGGRVCEPPLPQVRKKGALPLCCCVLTSMDQDGGSDSEADAVLHWAQHHESLDSDAAEASTAEDPPQMYVCNGPWSALRKATEESVAEYFSGKQRPAQVLKPRCGCSVGIAALAVWTSKPANACKRKGCA